MAKRRYVVVLRRDPAPARGRLTDLSTWDDVRYLTRATETHTIGTFQVYAGQWTFAQQLREAHRFATVSHARRAMLKSKFVEHQLAIQHYDALVYLKDGTRLVEVWPNPDAVAGLAALGSAR